MSRSPASGNEQDVYRPQRTIALATGNKHTTPWDSAGSLSILTGTTSKVRGEKEAIKRSSDGPVTVRQMVSDLLTLGITPGSTLIVHSSLSSIGWVAGGANAVVESLQQAVRPFGVLLMPTYTSGLSDPSEWSRPPVPEEWWDEIRGSIPPYDPETSVTRGVGSVPELFRTYPNVIRSSHPLLSFAGWGEDAPEVIVGHALDFGLGEESPLARVYDRDGLVLLLGVGFESNSSFHLGEIRSEWPGKELIPCSAPVSIDGHIRWKTFREIDYDATDFAEMGRDLSKHYDSDVRGGRVGYAKALLVRQRVCVDFASDWIHRKRRTVHR